MGSGNKRKNNDVVRINQPQVGGGTGSGSGTKRDINNVCPPAFEVRIKPQRALPDGTSISLRKDELFAFGELVGKLPPKYQEVITKCADSNIRYSGQVVNRGKDKVYARFEQAN